jgi:ribonuclease BN (tRNA processing enzyme)
LHKDHVSLSSTATRHVSASFSNMKATFLGTNGWYDTITGNTVCILIETEKYDIVLDAGNGIHKLDSYVSGRKPVFIFLSHFHLDHIAGLHILGKFKFEQELVICGPEGTKKVLTTLIALPFTMPFGQLEYRTVLLELPAEINKLPFHVEALPLKHASLTLGYRFRIDEKIVSYCPDTGYCENALKLAADADLLITECAYRPGQTVESWPHLNPETAARIAVESRVRLLHLVHFDASLYTSLEDRMLAEETAKKIFPKTVASLDGMQIEI